MMKPWFFLLSVLLAFSGCVTYKNSVGTRKYAPETLQKDYDLFQNIIEEAHPGLYWYMPKDSMDQYFSLGRSLLKDSLTEPGFRTVLNYVVSKLGCGHTSVRSSKQYARLRDTVSRGLFPLAFKLWPDTALVTANFHTGPSPVRRGDIITAIDGVPMQRIVDSLFLFLSTDGYNLTHKYQTLSNRGTFGAVYQSVFGARRGWNVRYTDSSGKENNAIIRQFTVPADSAERLAQTAGLPRPQKISRRERKKAGLLYSRELRIDSSGTTAFMDLNTFQSSGKLRSFFRRSFKQLQTARIANLVIDLRTNGGGNVINSNLLTKYIADQPFKIADSLYTRIKGSQYGQYQQHRFWNWLFAVFMTRKKADGFYHFGYYERKRFKPKRHNHFGGQVYVLSGGNTFSASTLFIKAVKEQKNVTIVGEETGGGAYGNNAWLIPSVTLPATRVRMRLPLYRLVIDKNEVKGFGVQPEVPAFPTTEAIRKNFDFKTAKALELINADKR
ncbi:MAG: S41 family peptidase [Chitinophagaceae bacterium]